MWARLQEQTVNILVTLRMYNCKNGTHNTSAHITFQCNYLSLAWVQLVPKEFLCEGVCNI